MDNFRKFPLGLKVRGCLIAWALARQRHVNLQILSRFCFGSFGSFRSSARFGSFRSVLARFGSFWLVLARFGSFWLVVRGPRGPNRAKTEPKPSRNSAEIEPKSSRDIGSPNSSPETSRAVRRNVGKLRAGAVCFLPCERKVDSSTVQCRPVSSQVNRAANKPESCLCVFASTSFPSRGPVLGGTQHTKKFADLRDLLGSSSPQFRGPTGLKFSRATTLFKKQSAKIWLENW